MDAISEVHRQIEQPCQSTPVQLESEPVQNPLHSASPEEIVHDVAHLEELVSPPKVLHATHGADLRRVRGSAQVQEHGKEDDAEGFLLQHADETEYGQLE